MWLLVKETISLSMLMECCCRTQYIVGQVVVMVMHFHCFISQRFWVNNLLHASVEIIRDVGFQDVVVQREWVEPPWPARNSPEPQGRVAGTGVHGSIYKAMACNNGGVPQAIDIPAAVSQVFPG